MSYRDPTAALFDLDGTLHDRDRAFRSWALAFARDRLDLAGDSAAAAVAFLADLDAGGRGPKEVTFAAAKARWPALAEPVPDLVAAFRAGLVGHVALAPGAAAVLDALDSEGLPWGVVTNGTAAAQRPKLAALGLAGRTPCLVVSEEVGRRKPDPAIFRLAADLLGVEASDVLFVGDHPEADVVGAAAAGMRTAWLRRGRAWPKGLRPCPDHLITALEELLPMMRPGQCWEARARGGGP